MVRKISLFILSLLFVMSYSALAEQTEWSWSGSYTSSGDRSLSLNITPNDEGGFSGWHVSLTLDGTTYEHDIERIGDAVAGTLSSPVEANIHATLSREGENGVLLTINGTETYHLGPDEEQPESDVKLSDDASDFVLLSEAVPDAILEIRYYSTYNFVGDRIDGYEQPVALLTREAAEALRAVSDDLIARGYRLKIFDAYRPQKAVSHFMAWALDPNDTRMKDYFYPELEKDTLFPSGYIAEHSGHSRGSTVDLTLFDMAAGREVDMGGTFDYFGELSHPNYTEITETQFRNRMLLREAMLKHGFRPLSEEWWHFTLENEPYPDTYFTFPVSDEFVK